MTILKVLINGRYDLVEVANPQVLPEEFKYRVDAQYTDGKRTFNLHKQYNCDIITYKEHMFYFNNKTGALMSMVDKRNNSTVLANVRFQQYHELMQELMEIVYSPNFQLIVGTTGKTTPGSVNALYKDANQQVCTIQGIIEETSYGINNWDDLDWETGVCNQLRIGDLPFYLKEALTYIWIESYGTDYVKSLAPRHLYVYPIGGAIEYDTCQQYNSFGKNPLRLNYAIWLRNKMVDLCRLMQNPEIYLVMYNECTSTENMIAFFKGMDL
ncbi:hypothetical protein Acj133p050 [Acinetobacter phage 133]|uniref:Uncharacterized protein n=1 Tax=Acinetobacter phage 133 TaxID=2919552 RepID=D9I616_9CAUD|nr:hypothetical protein Acj133p050 [Acinetobacter phage 133]ADJ19397.1 hypothetical protein Acj133p050 [Acinetobacter phage 133]